MNDAQIKSWISSGKTALGIMMAAALQGAST